MKNVFKNLGVFTLCIGIAFGLQHIPLQKILPAKAQTVRMVAGPQDNPLNTAYLTPTSSTLNTSLPAYALPGVMMFNSVTSQLSPVAIDLNADGLMDYAYSYSYTGYSDQYVLLNTGNGFNLAYVCTYRSSGPTYKGDCAQ